MVTIVEDRRIITSSWFESLRDKICLEFENIEHDFSLNKNMNPGKFKRTPWSREGGGGGVMSIMHGNVFEKVGVNISTVYGEFSEQMRKQIPGAEQNPQFFATGISLVAHMCSPLVPAVHFNTRYLETTKSWFGGGSDLTPMYEDTNESTKFHQAFKDACDKHNPAYYPDFKKQCDEYFYLKHRKEPRGIGGIFYDYLSNNFLQDFAFTKEVGITILQTYPEIVRAKMNLPWTKEQRRHQLIKRGRYVEFNLLYDRGTSFGLATNGNVEAILMSMPPKVIWPWKINMIKPGLYEHYKGQKYEVIGMCRHSETLEELVVYRALYGDYRLWVRPHKMFAEIMIIENERIPRFKFLGSIFKEPPVII